MGGLTLQERISWTEYINNMPSKSIEIKKHSRSDTYDVILSSIIADKALNMYRRGQLIKSVEDDTIAGGITYVRDIASNKYILYTLDNIKNNNDTCKINRLIRNIREMGIDYNIDDIKDIVTDTRDKERKQLIRLCTGYNHWCNIVRNKSSNMRLTNIDKDYRLSELLIRRMVYNLKNKHGYKIGSTRLKDRGTVKGKPITQSLNADIVIQFDSPLGDGGGNRSKSRSKGLIVDVKLYNKVYNNKGLYISNANRFQLNSYIDAYRDKMGRVQASGVLLHLVIDDEFDKCMELSLNRVNTGVCDKNKIMLHLLRRSSDVINMQRDFDKILSYELNRQEV